MKLEKGWLKPERLERVNPNRGLANKHTTLGGKPLFWGTRPINEMREALGLTQAQLAGATGMRRTMIANLESGRYAVFLVVGISMYLVFARIAAQKGLTPLYLEAKRDVARFIKCQRGSHALAVQEAERKVEAIRKAIRAREKTLAAAEAELRAV